MYIYILYIYHDLQVNEMFTNKNISEFLVLESFVNYVQTSGKRRIFLNYCH